MSPSLPPTTTPPTTLSPAPPKHRPRAIIIFLLVIFPLSLITFLYFYLTSTTTLISPLGSLSQILGAETHPQKTAKVIFGFLPYWEFKDRDSIRYDLLTHLAIFAADFNDQGHINTREANYQEPGWTALNSTTFTHIRRDAKAAGTKLILVIKAFDADAIDSIISHPTYTQNLINETLDLVKSKSYDGINIDFEYVPEANNTTKQNFTKFVTTLSQTTKQEIPGLDISVDVFGDTYQGNRIWQIEDLAPFVDHIIIMAYDYHRASSPTAGPVAPLYGAGHLWDQDITAALSYYTKKAPADKLILGVPYYGYEWTTPSTTYLSPTIAGSGSTATYKRVQQLIQDEDVDIHWDNQALAPWLTYTDHGSIQQIHYEDVTSLGLKYDLVRQSGLGGIGIWALGYDAGYSNLWDLISKKFFSPS